MSDIIEINSFETVKNIEISVFPTYREININKVSGGAVTSVNGQVGDVTIETTDNNFTDILKNKLDGIAVGAEVNVNADWNATTGDALILNKPTFGDMLKSVYDKDNSGIVDNTEAIIVTGRNTTGETLRRGTIIYISGSTGNRPNFVKAQANGEQTSAGTFGVITDDINNNSNGNCCVIGYLDNLDTRSNATHPFTNDTLNNGDTIYLSPTTAGFITNVKPSAPNHLVYLGKVTRTSPTNGTIVYRIQNGYELEELHNVAISGVADKELLIYDNASSLWKNKTLEEITGEYNFILSTPVSYTGSLQEVEVLRLEIPPYTFSENDMLKIPTLIIQKAGVVNSYSIRVKISTSETMPSTTTDMVALYNGAPTTTQVNMSRTWFLSGGVLRGFGTSNNVTDGIGSTTQLNVPFNNAITNYLYISIDSAGIQDTQTLVGFQLTNR
jgi:hypothetical protein